MQQRLNNMKATNINYQLKVPLVNLKYLSFLKYHFTFLKLKVVVYTK